MMNDETSNLSGRWPYSVSAMLAVPGLQPGLDNRMGRWPEMQGQITNDD